MKMLETFICEQVIESFGMGYSYVVRSMCCYGCLCSMSCWNWWLCVFDVNDVISCYVWNVAISILWILPLWWSEELLCVNYIYSVVPVWRVACVAWCLCGVLPVWRVACVACCLCGVACMAVIYLACGELNYLLSIICEMIESILLSNYGIVTFEMIVRWGVLRLNCESKSLIVFLLILTYELENLISSYWFWICEFTRFMKWFMIRNRRLLNHVFTTLIF